MEWKWLHTAWEWLLIAFAWIRRLFARNDQDMSEGGRLEMERIKTQRRAIFHKHYDILIGMAVMALVIGVLTMAGKVVDHYFPPVTEQQSESNNGK